MNEYLSLTAIYTITIHPVGSCPYLVWQQPTTAAQAHTRMCTVCMHCHACMRPEVQRDWAWARLPQLKPIRRRKKRPIFLISNTSPIRCAFKHEMEGNLWMGLCSSVHVIFSRGVNDRDRLGMLKRAHFSSYVTLPSPLPYCLFETLHWIVGVARGFVSYTYSTCTFGTGLIRILL